MGQESSTPAPPLIHQAYRWTINRVLLRGFSFFKAARSPKPQKISAKFGAPKDGN